MNLKEFNSLVDLFFYRVEKENSNTPFLEWLNPENKKMLGVPFNISEQFQIFRSSDIKTYFLKMIPYFLVFFEVFW